MKHIRPIGDEEKYLTAGNITEDHPIPDGFELVDGPPPVGAERIRIKSPIEQVEEIFNAMPIEVQLQHAGAFALAKHYTEKGEVEKVIAIIEAVAPSSESEPVKAQMLETLGG